MTQASYEQSLWHADVRMESLARDMIEKIVPAAWVESGSHLGFTSYWLAQNFPELQIHTVEIDPEFYRMSGENLEGFANVHRNLGDSRTFLREVIPTLTGPVIFWLDAHWYADHPLLGECEIVAATDPARLPCAVFVDDFHTGPEFPGDTNSPPMVVPLGPDYWVPRYEYKTGFSGYALWLRGLDYAPPTFMKRLS
jgi:hypothetical protein